LIDAGAALISASDCEGYFRHMFQFIQRALKLEEILP